MIPIRITASYPGLWRRKTKTATWRRALPENWEDIPEARRGRYFEALIGEEERGVRTVLRQMLQLPDWALPAIGAEDWATLAGAVSWMLPRPDCTRLPFPSFVHLGIRYHLPAPKGQNLCCLEYPLADEYYLKFYNTGDASALLYLVGVLCREEEPNTARALQRGDKRVPLYSRAEAEARGDRLDGLEPYLQFAVLLYFAGLKEYVYNTYKAWLFEDDEDIEEEEERDDDDDDYQEDKPVQDTAPPQPDFGWWGIFQEAAEAGLFGPLEQVYQAGFHDVAMWLVRQRIKADEVRRLNQQQARQHDKL